MKTFKVPHLPQTILYKGHELKMYDGEDWPNKNTEAEKLKAAGHIVALVEVRLSKNLRGRNDLHGKPYTPSVFIFWHEVVKSDKLIVTTVSIRGKWSHRKIENSAYLTIAKDSTGGAPAFQIAVQAGKYSTGTGEDYKVVDQQTALINITFTDGTIWSGTPRKLEQSLQAIRTIKDYYDNHGEGGTNRQEIINLLNITGSNKA